MIRNAFWFFTGVASSYAISIVAVKRINKNPEFADQVFTEARNL